MKKRHPLHHKVVKFLNKRRRRPTWLWRWHYLVSGLVVFGGVGMLLGFLQFTDTRSYTVQAAATDNVIGWVWSDHIGWISLNDLNPQTCAGSCGTYGVKINPTTREITGFGWSDKSGWVCFGSSCGLHAACNGTPPQGGLNAVINAGSGAVEVRGWVKVCSEGDNGWISLNCADFTGACTTYPYKVYYNTATKWFQPGNPPTHPTLGSLGWNGYVGGNGFGYVDFEYANSTVTESNCSDGVDNDLNGVADCADAACNASAACNEIPGNTDAWGQPLCMDGIDDNGNGTLDCTEPACQSASQCQETPTNTDYYGNDLCADGIDDDGDGTIDCVDLSCDGYASCTLIGEAACGAGAEACCTDGVDNDGLMGLDCADPNCGVAPSCLPAWLQAKFGNVYAQKGITGSAGKESEATYCLTSQGAITDFASGSGCSETGAVTLSLPKSSTQYKGTLGSLDINGILNGRYGTVQNLASGDITAQLPNILAGKVYRVVGNATLNTKTLLNGSTQTERGNGLLIVEGDLSITGNVDYTGSTNIQSLRNLASFGIIVKKNGLVGGNINISSGVATIAAAIFAEDTIHTGTSGGVDTTPLLVKGLMAAYKIDLQRNYRDAVVAAETVVFDGRAVANPPPGMSDVAKSLPTSQDAF
ncbi:MAG: hypothetical protein RDU25_04080 [Patescibacteria group bacterium]|nr:hypothetical protein [Patescibacteria group bacterium]